MTDIHGCAGLRTAATPSCPLNIALAVCSPDAVQYQSLVRLGNYDVAVAANAQGEGVVLRASPILRTPSPSPV